MDDFEWMEVIGGLFIVVVLVALFAGAFAVALWAANLIAMLL